MTSSTRMSSAVMIILRVAAGGLDDGGDRRLGHRVQRVGEGELAGVDDLELDLEAMLGAQPRGGRGAEDVHDAAQAALLVDAELARTAEVDRAQPARAPALAVVGALDRGPAAAGLVEQRVDLGWRRGSRSSQAVTSLDPASRTVTLPVATWTRTVRPTLAGGRGRRDGDAGAQQRGAHRGLVAGADLHAGAAC